MFVLLSALPFSWKHLFSTIQFVIKFEALSGHFLFGYDRPASAIIIGRVVVR